MSGPMWKSQPADSSVQEAATSGFLSGMGFTAAVAGGLLALHIAVNNEVVVDHAAESEAARAKAAAVRAAQPQPKTKPGQVYRYVDGKRELLGSLTPDTAYGEAWAKWIDNEGRTHRRVKELEFVE